MPVVHDLVFLVVAAWRNPRLSATGMGIVPIAAFAVPVGFATVYVVRQRSAGGKWAKRLEKMPPQDVVDDLTVRFVLVGFLLWGIMIVTGAIWANESRRRYWSWDPIETRSLVVWLIYAVYLHLKYMRKLRGERLAWFAIVAMPIVLFCLVGIPTVFNSIHAGYIGGGELRIPAGRGVLGLSTKRRVSPSRP